MSGSRALQKVIKVAYLGRNTVTSHLAAVERFGQAVEYMRVGFNFVRFSKRSIATSRVRSRAAGKLDDGGVSDTLEMFMRLPQLKVGAEVRL